MKAIKFLNIGALLFTIALGTACVKGKWDTIPDASNVDPGLATNMQIYPLKQKLGNASNYKITEDLTIAAVVVANDKGGNFYKQIVAQDSTSGISILIEKNGLYNDYPVGRKIYIKAKGLILSSYGRYIQMGYALDATNSLAGIPSALIDKYIVKANYPSPYTIRTVSISDLSTININNDAWLGTLIKIDSANFSGADAGAPYAQDATVSSGTDRRIEECSGASVIMRNSAYANFAKFLTPSGRGNVFAIFSRYNNTPQLLIRDTNDIVMSGPRCGANNALFSIADVRARVGTADTNTPIGQKIEGIVIVDKDNANSTSQNLVIQDGTAGIVVRLPSPGHTYAMGDKIEVDISGAKLAPFAGTLQINILSLGKLAKIGTGAITPELVTIAQLNANMNAYESELVSIDNVTFPVGTYGGTSNKSTNFSDGTGTFINFVRSTATFALTNMPTSPVKLTGIVGRFNTANQLSMRNLDDVK